MEDKTKTAKRAATPSNNALVDPERLPYMNQIETPETRLAVNAG